MSYNKHTLKNSVGVNIPLNDDPKKRKKDFERAMKIFTREVKNSKRVEDSIERMEYIKPTTKRREERKYAIRNQQIKHDSEN